MARSIANFLVGIGLDTTDWDKGARKVDTNLSSFRSKASIAGGALAAAFSAASLAAIKAGTDADKFVRKVSNMDTSTKYVYSLTSAFERLGGGADDAFNAISRAEEVLRQLRSGDASALTSATKASQLNLQSLQGATNGEDFINRLSDIMAQPGVQNWQKVALQDAFSISNEARAGMEQGSAHLRALVEDASKYAENLEKAAQAGREYSATLAKINDQVAFIGQELSSKILPRFTEILNGFSGFIDRNIDKVPAAADYAAENAGGISAIFGGLTLSSMGAMASKWLPTIGKGAMTAGRATTAAGAASLLWDVRPEHIESLTGWKPNSYIWDNTPADVARDVGDWWRGGKANSPATRKTNLSQIARSDESVPSPDWYKGSATTPAQSVMRPSLSQQARSDASVPQPIVIDNRITLDGREMARWKKEQDALINFATIDEISSTVAR
jgi:hypothetical protein